MIFVNRKIAASAAALALAGGLVACSNDDAATTATDAVTSTNVATETEASATETLSSTATETATETTSSSSETATETATSTNTETETVAESAAAGATEEITLADGSAALVPAGVVETMNEYVASNWGQPTAVEEIDGGWVVTYDNEHYITWKESTGGSPIWGEIANTWLNDVRGARTVGFPLMPETPNTDGSGWNQEVENGTIDWSRDGGADAPFTATIDAK